MRDKIRKLSRANQLRLLFYLYWLRLQEITLPRLVFSRGAGADPTFFAMLTTSIMFSLLTILPLHPLSLFVSFGGGLSFALIITSIRPVRFAHVIGR